MLGISYNFCLQKNLFLKKNPKKGKFLTNFKKSSSLRKKDFNMRFAAKFYIKLVFLVKKCLLGKILFHLIDTTKMFHLNSN